MRETKNYFFFCLKENVIIFDVFDYIEEIAADCVDYLYEWNLFKNGYVYCKRKVIKEYVENKVLNDLSHIKQKIKHTNSKILCFYCKKDILNVWSNYFEDPGMFIRIAKKITKRLLPNFIEINYHKKPFQTINGMFDDTPCVIPNGDDEEFLIKIQKKLSHTPLTKNFHTVK